MTDGKQSSDLILRDALEGIYGAHLASQENPADHRAMVEGGLKSPNPIQNEAAKRAIARSLLGGFGEAAAAMARMYFTPAVSETRDTPSASQKKSADKMSPADAVPLLLRDLESDATHNGFDVAKRLLSQFYVGPQARPLTDALAASLKGDHGRLAAKNARELVALGLSVCDNSLNRNLCISLAQALGESEVGSRMHLVESATNALASERKENIEGYLIHLLGYSALDHPDSEAGNLFRNAVSGAYGAGARKSAFGVIHTVLMTDSVRIPNALCFLAELPDPGKDETLGDIFFDSPPSVHYRRGDPKDTIPLFAALIERLNDDECLKAHEGASRLVRMFPKAELRKFLDYTLTLLNDELPQKPSGYEKLIVFLDGLEGSLSPDLSEHVSRRVASRVAGWVAHVNGLNFGDLKQNTADFLSRHRKANGGSTSVAIRQLVTQVPQMQNSCRK